MIALLTDLFEVMKHFAILEIFEIVFIFSNVFFLYLLKSIRLDSPVYWDF